jgi:hypothetical protein
MRSFMTSLPDTAHAHKTTSHKPTVRSHFAHLRRTAILFCLWRRKLCKARKLQAWGEPAADGGGETSERQLAKARGKWNRMNSSCPPAKQQQNVDPAVARAKPPDLFRFASVLYVLFSKYTQNPSNTAHIARIKAPASAGSFVLHIARGPGLLPTIKGLDPLPRSHISALSRICAARGAPLQL